MPEVLRVPAIRFRQGKNRELYSFVVDGKAIPSFANIVRIGRDRENQNEIFGYQRPEVFSHIKEIRRYLESENPMLPNALVVALEREARFTPYDSSWGTNCHSTAGLLEIPLSTDASEKIGWIVDGQQRTAAIREASVRSFPVSVVAFVANQEEQREQFILVNSTKPLPKDLIYELLPATNTRLAPILEKRKLPSLIAMKLNFPTDASKGPFGGRVRMPTCQSSEANISYNSVLRMLENSLSDGALLELTSDSETYDIQSMLQLLNSYWSAVSSVFHEAWRRPPTKSRLTHGAGIVAMGFLMDAICDRVAERSVMAFRNELLYVAESCRWTEGKWPFGNGTEWNEIQNTPRDIENLSRYLVSHYLEARGAT